MFLKVLYQWKFGKLPPAGTVKSGLVVAWNAAKHEHTANLPAKWTDRDEQELTRLKTAEIQLHNTEVGRQAGQLVHSLKAGLKHMSAEQVKELKEALPASPIAPSVYSTCTLSSPEASLSSPEASKIPTMTDQLPCYITVYHEKLPSAFEVPNTVNMQCLTIFISYYIAT